MLSASALASSSADEVLDAVASAVRDALGLDQVHISEVSQDAAVGFSRVSAFAESDAGQVAEEYSQVLDDRPSGVARVVSTKRSFVVVDARGSQELRQDFVERFHAASTAFIPLVWDGEVRHVLILLTHAPHPFDAGEIAVAETMADVAAGALARHETVAHLHARAQRDAALARAARALNESLDLGTVLDTLVREADAAVGGDMAGVYVGDGVRGGIATAGHNTPPDWHGYLMKPGEGVAGQVLATGRAAISNAYQSEVRLPENPGLRRVQTAVAVPMTWSGELKGALSIGFVRMRRITEEDLRTLGAIADLATVACRNAEAYERARRQADG